MSTSIDERVVEMKFDNAQFESGVKTTLDTLKKLKDSLNLEGAVKGLSSIASAGGSLGLSSIGSSVTSISDKFSALETIAVGALLKIGEQAVDAGTKLIKSLSTDNIAKGWEKFGEKTTSVATLVAQGYDLDTVNEQMERLNWFTDETSYNFTDMVSNISKFTATGQDLEPSVTAMEGIATWAALSGQNAGTASRAMYQLSQAMGKGALRYDDWKSIQNASMDTQEFRNQALSAAEALGVVRKNADDTFTVLSSGKQYSMAEMFASDALTREQWFSSDVMMKVFQQYSAAVDDIYEYAKEKGITASEAMAELGMNVDQFGLKAFKAAQEARTWADVIDSVKDAVSTGWMNTFELIFGNYEEATQVFTWWANELYDVFAESGNKRNEVLSLWKEQGGRDDLVWGIYNSWTALTEVISAVKDEFNKAFGISADTEEEIQNVADVLLDATSRFKDFSESIIPSEEELEDLRSVAAAVFGVAQRLVTIIGTSLTKAFGLVSTAIDLAKEAFKNIIPDGAIDKVYEILDGINSFISNFSLTAQNLDNISAGFEGVFAVVDIVGQAFSALWDVFSNPFADTFISIKDTVLDLVGVLGDFLTRIDEIVTETDVFHTAFDNILNVLEVIGDAFSEAFGLDNLPTDFADFLDGLADKFENFANSITPNKDKLDDFRDVASRFFDVLSNIKDLIVTGVSVAFDNLVGILTSVKDAFLDAMPPETLDNIGGFIDTLKDIVEKFRLSDDALGKLRSTFGGIFAVVNLVIQAVSALWDVFGPPIADAITSIGDGILTVTGNIGDFLIKISDAARESDFFKTVFESIKSVIDGVIDGITGLSDAFSGLNLGNFSDLISGLFSSLGSGVGGFLQNGNIIESIATFISNALGGLGSILENLDIWSLVKNIGKFAVFGTVIKNVISIVGALGKSLTSIAKIPTVFVDILEGASSALNGLAMNLKADALLKLAEAIAILVASLFLMAMIDPSAMSSAVAALLIIMAGLALVMKSMGSMNLKDSIANFIQLKALGSIFTSIAASFLIMAAAIKLITAGNTDIGEVALAAGILTAMLGIVAIVIVMLSKVEQAQNINKLTNAFIKMSAAFVIMAAAIRILTAGNISMGEVAIAAGILSGMLTVLAVIVILISKVEKASNVNKISNAFLKMSAAFVIMATAIRILTAGDVSMGDIALAAAILSGLTLVMAAVVILASKTVGSSAKITTMGIVFAAMSASLILVAAAIRIISDIPWQSALASAVGLALVMTAMAGVIAIISKFGSLTAAADLMALSVAVLAIAAALSVMAMANVGIGQVAALCAALLVLAGVAAIVNALGLDIALLAIAAAVMALGIAAVGIGVGIYAFASAIQVLCNNADSLPYLMEQIAESFIAFEDTLNQNIDVIVQFIANIILGLIAAIPTLGMALLGGLAQLISMALTFIVDSLPGLVDAVIALIIIGINDISLAILNSGTDIGLALGRLVYALGALIVELLGGFIAGFVDNIIPGSGDKVKAAFDEAFGESSPIQQEILDSNEEMKTKMEDGFSGMADAAQAGLDAGGTVDYGTLYPTDTTVAEAKESASSLGNEAYLAYKEKVESGETPDFAKGMRADDIKAEQRAVGHSLGEAAAEGHKEGIEGANTPDVAKGLRTSEAKAEQIAAGKALAEAATDEYKKDVEEAPAPEAAKPISSDQVMAEQEAAGEANADEFTTSYESELESEMEDVPEIVEAPLEEVDTETPAMESADEYISAMVAQFTGSEDQISTSGANLGTSFLSGFTGGADGSGATDSITQYMSSITDQLSGSSGDMETTGSDLSTSFLSGFTSDTEGANTAGQDITNAIADGISSNEAAVTDAASQLSTAVTTAFGDSYDSAFQAGSSVSFGFGAGMYSNMSAVSEAAGYISDTAAGKFDEGADEANTAGQNLVSQFSVGIVLKNGIAESSAQFVADNVEGKLDSKQTDAFQSGQMLIQQFSNGIRLMTNQAITAVLNVVQNTTRNLQTTVPAAQRTGTSVVSTLAATLRNSGTVANAAYQLGVTVSNSIANGINAYSGRVSSAASYIVNYLSYYKSSTYNYGYNAGANFSLGMGYGISAYAYAAANAAAAVAARAAAAARARLRIASPSRVAAEIGMYFDQGLAVGIRDNVGDIESASEYATENALNSFNQIVSRIQDVLDGNIDIDPTIRPVLDLSAIQNGANQLDGMLSGSYSYATNASGGLNGISSTSQIMTGLDAIASKLTNQKQSPNISITVNAGDISDPDELASIISDRIQFEYAQIGASIGGGY